MARSHVKFFVYVISIVISAYENDCSPQVSRTNARRGENFEVVNEPVPIEGSYELNNYGVMRMSKWNKTSEIYDVSIQSSRCYDLEECLGRGPITGYRGRDHSDCNFIILPSGEVVKMLGWDRSSGVEMKICLVPMDKQEPSARVLEAFAFLMQAGVSTGKVERTYDCSSAERYPDYARNEIFKWCRYYQTVFDNNLLVHKTPLVSNLEVVSRCVWDPMEPTRDLDSMAVADVVKVHAVSPPCSSRQRCLQAAQYVRRRQTKEHGNLVSNFILGGDGRIYEGLGWNSTREDRVLNILFLVGSKETALRGLALSAFSLLVREGVKVGKISEVFTLNTESFSVGSEELEKWAFLSREVSEDESTVTAPTDVVSEATNGEFFYPLRYPIGRVLFTTQPGGVYGLPFVMTRNGRTVKSARQVLSNFYFTGDEVAYEGLGWNRSGTKDEVVFEFMTSGPEALPCNQSMLVSTFLIREGVKMGYLRADYDLKVADHTSIEFENVVRVWDRRVRG